MSGFLGCISKNKIGKNLFDKSLDNLRKNHPEDVYIYRGLDNNTHYAFAEFVFNNGVRRSFRQKRDNIQVISHGLLYDSTTPRRSVSRISTGFTSSRIISNMYKSFGKRLVDKIEGKYSCAIYDKHKKEVCLIRDSFGYKSLYYYLDDNYFIFSSEIRPIVSFLNKIMKVSIDEESVLKYFCFGFIPPPSTLFKRIKKLDKARLLLFDVEKWQIKKDICYWDVNKIQLNTKLTEPEIIRETEILLENSISNNIRALGSFIPAVMLGGLDSTAVTMYLARHFPNLESYTMKYSGMRDVRDVRYATKTTGKLGISNIFINLDHKNVLENFKETIEHSDEPTLNLGKYPYYFMSKNIRTKTPYVFDGTAAEFMFGCSNFPTNNLLKPLRSWMATYNFAAKFFKKHHSGFYDSLRLPIMGNWVSKFLFLAPYDSSKDLHKLLKLKSAYQYKKIYYDVAKCLNKFQQDDVLNNIIYLDYRHHGWIFTAESEKSAMNAGVEMVSPYADRKLIEYFFTIQEKWKTNQVDTKYILRKIVAKYLGGDIAFRKSNTLVEFPLGNWIREELRGLFEQYLFIENEYIDTKFVKQIFSDHLQKRADYRLLLYQIFQFQYLINTFTKW